MTDQPVAVPSPAVMEVVAGVDTHRDTHHAAVLSMIGGELGDREFPATAAGYTALLDWLDTHGTVVRVEVEGTSSYGAGLTRFLHTRGVEVVGIDRPDRRSRRTLGKSDPLEAYAAARTVLAGIRVVVPKAGTGIVEAIRVLRITRRGAVKGPHPDHQPAPIPAGHRPTRTRDRLGSGREGRADDAGPQDRDEDAGPLGAPVPGPARRRRRPYGLRGMCPRTIRARGEEVCSCWWRRGESNP